MPGPKWSLSDLPEAQQGILRQIYGPQVDAATGYAPGRQIQFVRELDEEEKYLFSKRSPMSAQSITQTLYKVKGELSPLRLNRALGEMAAGTEALRLNFCPMGEFSLAVVFRERIPLPPIVYRNMQDMEEGDLDSALRKIMEADMRQGFDLRHDCLARLAVFHTGPDEYAVLLTVAQPIRGRFHLAGLLRKAMGIPEAKESEAEALAAAWLRSESRQLTGAMRDYWAQLLGGLPPLPRIPYLQPKKPGAQGRKAYLAYVPPDIFSDIRLRARSNRKMLLAILQAAWGILLQSYNDCRDVAYCLLLPGNREGDEGARNLIPVRLRSGDGQTVQEIVDKSFQQLIVSQPYASFAWQELQALPGGERFDHFLGFYDFLAAEPSYAKADGEPTGKVVAQSSWDAHGMRLSLYFRQEGERISLSFLYDGNALAEEDMGLLSREYSLSLQQMLTDWNLPFAEFRPRLQERLAACRAEGKAETGEPQAKVQDVLSRLRLLQGCEEGTIRFFCSRGRLETRFEGDRLSGEEIEKQLFFVAAGKVARSIECGDGWYNTLDILRENSWVNETALLPDRKTHLSAEVLTEQATFLVIPLMDMQTIMKQHPAVGLNIIRHLGRQLEKYQRLWLQS